MAEILPFRKPRPKKTEPELSSATDLGEFLVEMVEKLTKLGADPSLVTLRIQLHINGLHGQIRDSNVAIRRRGIEAQNLSLERLIKIAQKSTPAQWTQHPAYFQALVDEINSRPGT